MNIIHLSDLHYKSKSFEKFTESRIIEKLCKSLSQIPDKIDLVIFTGDLVNRGISNEDFKEAREFFLDRVSESLNISTNDIIICPGNHDVDRTKRLESLELFFKDNILTNTQLNDFANKRDKDYENSISGVDNYVTFINDYYSDDSVVEDLLSIHIKKINDVEVGILSLNSAWRCMDDNSFGNLLLPLSVLEKGLSKIKHCSSKLVALHHPLFWFKEFNYKEIQSIIHKEFDIVFSGHIHDSQITTHYKYNNGIFAHVSPASMTYDKNYIGYSFLKYDLLEKDKVEIVNYKYVQEFDKFISDEPVTTIIPSGLEKTHQNHIRNKILSKLELELELASDLLLNKKADDVGNENFLTFFNKPILKTRSKSEIKLSDSPSNFNFENLLVNSDNYIIFGHDKSGKSSILKYIQINHLRKFSNNGNIPFYLDFSELENSVDKNWNLITHISRYFELSKNKTKELIKNHKFRLLIDNYDPNHEVTQIIHDFIEDNENVNYVMCSDHLTSRIVDNYDIGDKTCQKLFIHDITRSEVRTYAEKWFDRSVESKDVILDKVISFCKQLEMPLNYWTVSILLMIHKKSRFDLSKNLFEILDLCVDEILNKKYISLTRSKVNFKQLKSICGKLSCFLLEHDPSQYSSDYIDILGFIKSKVESNIRLNANPKEILDYLIESGVLKYKSDDKISFRLNGVFEYFIAYNMSQDESFKNGIINDDLLYLSFKNEFEIYSGLRNDNKEFLLTIFEKTRLFFDEINAYYRSKGTPDQLLVASLTQTSQQEMKNIATELITSEPLDDKNKDKFKDQVDPIDIRSEIAAKKLYDISRLDSEVFERYISILARIYKTMDEIEDTATLNEIFDFLLETYINFGFFLIKEIENEIVAKEDYSDDFTHEENILELLNRFIPIISQVTFSDSIAHYNVEAIVLNKIRELQKDAKPNEYKIFILYFVLMDIDEKNILKYTDELLSIVKTKVLRYSIILKLNYYFSFNGHRNKKVANFLKVTIEKTQIELNDKINKSSLQSTLDKQKKRNFSKK